MKRGGIQFILAGCLIALGPATSVAAPKPNLTILVYNDCRAPGETVSKALLLARRIFLQAGIETDWRIGELGRPYPASAFGVQIVKGPSKASEMHEALGAALFSGNGAPASLVKIFYRHIEERVTFRLDPHTLLAHAMAHEIGHLLLGKEHTPETIMAALWRKAEYALMSEARLGFSESQASQIQTAVRLRMNL